MLVRESAGRRVVEHACERALAAGVRPGFTVTQARALLPRSVELAALPHEPEREARALRAAAEWATRFSPISAPDPPDGLLLDVGGCERLFGGEAALLGSALRAARRLGLHARGAIASTAGCAQAVARFGPPEGSIVPPGGERAALAPLPVRALRPDETFATALEEVGVRTVGQLLELERKDLAARFGGDLLLLVDRALGRALEALDPVRAEPPPRVERAFPGPVRRLEMVLGCVRELLDRLAAALAERESGAREVTVELARSDVEPWRARLVLARPSRDPVHLWKLLEPKLERAHLGFGVERIALVAPRTGPLRPRQEVRWSEGDESVQGTGADRHLAELVDTLAGRLGPERTVRFEPVETHVPERALRARPALAAGPPAPRAGGGSRAGSSSGSGPRPGDRPPLLFDPPEPAEVLASVPGGVPLRLRWRGGEEEVLHHKGPERLALPWWTGDAPSSSRDYFRVQDARGRWLWLFRELRSERWFVHGEWG